MCITISYNISMCALIDVSFIREKKRKKNSHFFLLLFLFLETAPLLCTIFNLLPTYMYNQYIEIPEANKFQWLVRNYLNKVYNRFIESNNHCKIFIFVQNVVYVSVVNNQYVRCYHLSNIEIKYFEIICRRNVFAVLLFRSLIIL